MGRSLAAAGQYLSGDSGFGGLPRGYGAAGGRHKLCLPEDESRAGFAIGIALFVPRAAGFAGNDGAFFGAHSY